MALRDSLFKERFPLGRFKKTPEIDIQVFFYWVQRRKSFANHDGETDTYRGTNLKKA